MMDNKPGPKAKEKSECPRCKRILSITWANYCHNCTVVLQRKGLLEKQIKPILPTDFTIEQKEILTGSLLGDGMLFRYKETHLPYYAVLRTISDESYALWQANKFIEFLPNQTRILEYGSYNDKRTNKIYSHIRFKTRRITLLQNWYNLWYPNNKKVVPDNLVLTPLSIAVWFCDDGNVNLNKNREKEYLRMKFSTDGFLKQDVEKLSLLLENRYNSKFGIYKNGNGYNIQVGKSQTVSVFEDIKDVFPISMNRKMNIYKDWRNLNG